MMSSKKSLKIQNNYCMWKILKIDKKKFDLLKSDFTKKLDNNIKYYRPMILVQRYKNNKLFSKKFNLLEDYIFCYHTKFCSKNTLTNLKFCRGLKYFLEVNSFDQNEINNFIERCKNSEDVNGNLTMNFFKIKLNTKYRFKSGPMTNKLFNILEIQKNKIKILLGDINTTINKKDYLFYPV